MHAPYVSRPAAVPKPYDAVVLGGGPSGATCGIMLARAGWRVAIVERQAFPRRKVCGEYLSLTNWALFEDLGISQRIAELSGPPVHTVGLFAGRAQLSAPLPPPQEGQPWGCALRRDQLDTLLMEEAQRQGVEVLQPCTVESVARKFPGWECTVQPHRPGHEQAEPQRLQAHLVIAAHGSWGKGDLPTEPPRYRSLAGDLFGFKAHFTGCTLRGGWMPLLCFPGGYGGMVHVDGGRTSLSCCIRRDALEKIRQRETSAGESVLEHIRQNCQGVDQVLRDATLDEPWLAAGPIRPGIRGVCQEGIFLVGNAAGEAHPVVAEGISMAMQSAWLLCQRLLAEPERGASPAGRRQVAQSYARAWHEAFAPRIYSARAIAHWAMRPQLVRWSLPLLARMPMALSWGARFSGKSNHVITTGNPA